MPEGKSFSIEHLLAKTKEQEPISGHSIVFDNGNTMVFDPFDEIKETVSKSAEEIARHDYGFQLDTSKFLEAWSEANATIDFPFSSHFSQEEPFVQAGLKAAGVDDSIRPFLSLSILSEYRKQFREVLKNSSRSVELREVLQTLRQGGKHLAVISNDRDFATRSMMAWMGIHDLFDHFLTSEEIGVEKPDPKVFAIAAERFGKSVSDIIYVGDDPERDVKCGHEAGVKTILYVPPQMFRTSKSWRSYSQLNQEPDATIDNFRDLLVVIK